MAEHQVRTLVFSSSATVYSADEPSPLAESALLAPVNPYGRTKQQIEEALADLGAADPSWRIAMLRYFNPVGAHPSGRIGEDPAGVPNNLLPYVAQVAIGRQAKVTVHGADYATPDGTGVRDYVHVMDLAQGHIAALEFLDRHRGVFRWNLGTGKGHSVLEVIDNFAAASGREIPFEIGARRPSRSALPVRLRRKSNWAGSRNGASRKCAGTIGAGRRTTRAGSPVEPGRVQRLIASEPAEYSALPSWGMAVSRPRPGNFAVPAESGCAVASAARTRTTTS